MLEISGGARSMVTRVHQTASVARGAILGDGVSIGPYAVIEEQVEIGDDSCVGSHAVIHSCVRIGSRNRIHPHAVLGGEPQDLSFSGRETWLVIGDDNIFREYVTVHRATDSSDATIIGSGCYLMAYAHVAHDCRIDDRVTLTNGVTLGGHVHIGERAMLGGLVPVHQFVRVGAFAMVGGATALRKDVLPFSLVAGDPARHYRLNAVGLRRAHVTGDRYLALRAAFRALRKGRALDELPETAELKLLRVWLAAPSKRGLTGFAGERKADG